MEGTHATRARRIPPLATIAGLAAIVVCVGLAAVAYALYPYAFSPAANWISDLGNTLLNPSGSIVFRLDMIAVGVALAVFFVGLTVWLRGQRLIFKAFLVLGQFSGVAAAVALVMTGIYSENDRTAHAIWVTVLFIALASAIWFIGWAPVWHPRLPQRIPYVALAAGAADLASIIVRRHWLEWLAVALLLCFVAAVALGTWSMGDASTTIVRAEPHGRPAATHKEAYVPYVLIEHDVGDWGDFKDVYLDDLERRRRSGSKGGQVYRTVAQPNKLVILLEWDTVRMRAASPTRWSSNRRCSGRPATWPRRGCRSSTPRSRRTRSADRHPRTRLRCVQMAADHGNRMDVLTFSLDSTEMSHTEIRRE